MISFCVYADGTAVFDGQAGSVPAVGETISFDGVDYEVESRTWERRDDIGAGIDLFVGLHVVELED